jgi:protein-S-isoprenylcysteine O-methyltransferase Ste14
MHPAAFWLFYALPAYVLWTLAFPLRYGFWPVAGRFPPRNRYAFVDFLLGLVLVAYSIWIVLGPRPDPARIISVPAGVCIYAAGVLLRWWAVFTLGPHWRIGHDERDARAEFVQTGPYRFVHHPINAALILVAIGQALMTGLDARALTLLSASVIYFIIQGRAEDKLWKNRNAQNKPPDSEDHSAL